MEMRRIRNRTLSGLESVHRMAGGGMGGQMMGGQMGGPPHGMDPHLNRPGSAGSRPITPSFSNDKDPGQQFVDFNPAGEFFTKCLGQSIASNVFNLILKPT